MQEGKLFEGICVGGPRDNCLLAHDKNVFKHKEMIIDFPFTEDAVLKHVEIGKYLFSGKQGWLWQPNPALSITPLPKSSTDKLKFSDLGWTLVKTAQPKPHAKYLVRREGYVHTATPCYGMHRPWWVPMGINRQEHPPTDMLDTDEWIPLT